MDDVGFVWDILTDAWEEGFSKLLLFKEAEGHCRVPDGFNVDGFNLGSWASNQRTAKDRISPERKQRLDDVGFVWDILTDAWEEGFSKLLLFKEAEGHCRVPKRFQLNGFSLGEWVVTQKKAKNRISSERRRRLDGVGFVWDVLAETWEEGLNKLTQFKETEGHCNVPQRFKLDGYSLGQWVSTQRRAKDRISSEDKQRLDDLGFNWDVLAEAWEEGFSKLLQFKDTEGHCNVPHGFKLDGYSLGQWVSVQRRAKDRISTERQQRLDDVGFVWDVISVAWEEGFSNLLRFKEAERHCKVPQKYRLGGFNLGNWVSHQRTAKDSMSPERKQKLDDIGFVWAASKGKT